MTIYDQIKSLPPHELNVLLLIHAEYKRAKEKHPKWPLDAIYQTAIIQEECGELIRAAVQFKLEGGEFIEIHKEAIQTGAMVLRLLCNE